MEQKSLSDRIWKFFSSVKLAIVVFSLIALTSIVGTIIEQQAPMETNMKVLGRIVGESAAPAVYSVLNALGFMNMYRSWWFLSLLALFALNLLVCSIERFPAIWRIARTPIKPLPPDTFKSMQMKAELSLGEKPDLAREKAIAAMKSIGFNASLSGEEGGGWQLYSQKTPWSRFGIYMAHFSIIIILAGAVLGKFLGFEAFMNIPEGSGYSVAISTGGVSQSVEAERDTYMQAIDASNGDYAQAAQSLNMPVKDLKTQLLKAGIIPLGFTVKCLEFDVDYYPNTDMPKAYKSHLQVIDGGQVVVDQWIGVNKPLRYKGVTFYQSSYGPMGNYANGIAMLTLKSATGQTQDVSLGLGQSATIPGTKTVVKVGDFTPALAFDDSQRPYTYSKMMVNPAIRLDVTGPSGSYSEWVLQRFPESWRLTDGNIAQFNHFWGVQYTGLQTRKDPGVALVYLGCIALALGLFMAFFMSHRRLWVRGIPEKGGTRLMVAGSASKNKPTLERQIEKMISLLKEGGR